MVEDSFKRQVAIIVSPLYLTSDTSCTTGLSVLSLLSSGPKNNKLYVEVMMSHIIQLTPS